MVNGATKVLVVKLLGLGSFIGGPLYFADLLKPHLGSPQAFLIAFSPIAPMVVGALSLGTDPKECVARFLVSTGLVGIGLLLLLNTYAFWELFLLHALHPNRQMIAVGIAVGVLASVANAQCASGFFRQLPNLLVR